MGNNPKPQGAVQTGLESKKVSVWILILAVLITAALTYFGTTLTVSPKRKLRNLRKLPMEILIVACSLTKT